MKLALFSTKKCWMPDGKSPFSDGGFPFQVRALSELFDSTIVVLPTIKQPPPQGALAVCGHNLEVRPVRPPSGGCLTRKLSFPLWVIRHCRVLLRTVRSSDAIHAPVPGDIGTVGILLALLFRKPLLVRYCGKWPPKRTLAKIGCRLLMETFAGGRNLMLATGDDVSLPSTRNPNIRWIFATSLSAEEMARIANPRRMPEEGCFRLAFVGRLERGKGVQLILRGMPALLRRYPKLELDVVGDGSQLEELRRFAQTEGIAPCVRFHGRLTHAEVLNVLREATLFCFPTASEGFPKAVLEALASGLPVVANPVSVLPRLIGSDCGCLMRELSSQALVDAVLSCLSDPGKYEEMSRNATLKAQRYSLENWRDAIGAWAQEAWGPLRQQGMAVPA